MAEKKSKEAQEEENINLALDLAGKIFKIVKDPRFLELEPEIRHKVLVNKYQNFANAYPVILRFIARDVKYQEKAFRRFLEGLRRDPGKGMDGFIEHQANYAKYLYMEDARANGTHWNMSKANTIWKIEYEHMKKFLKKIKDDEAKAKNEFEEESKKHLTQKRSEFLKFLEENSESSLATGEETEGENLEQYERAALGLPPKSLGDVEIDKLSTADLAEYISHLEEYQKDLSKEVTELDQKIQDLEKQTPVAKTSASTQSDKTLNTKSVVLDSEWLEGTAAAKPRTSQGSTPKPTNRVKKVPRVLRVPQEKQTQREAIEEIDRLAREIEGPKEKNKKK